MSLHILERLLLQRSGVRLPRSVVAQSLSSRRWYSSDPEWSRDDTGSSRLTSEDDHGHTSSEIRPRIERPIANEPLRDDDSMSSFASSPRIYRGVHRKELRRKGQTPAEQAAIDASLKKIFDDLDPSGPNAFDLGPRSIFSAGTSTGTTGSGSTGDPTGLQPWSRKIRRGNDREENEEMVEALDELKEEVSAISTDFELLDWARRRIFDTLPRPFSVSAATDSSSSSPLSEMEAPAPFPSTYPRILAHLMKVSRQHFNNPHLSLSLFHQAQTHSPESYLSGCLSSAYTELIRTRWDCFRDLEGVSRAIREMDANAVSWDRTTQTVIGKIIEQVGKEMLQSRDGEGQGFRWGEEAREILFHLEKKLQRALKTSEVHDYRAKRERERRLWS